MRAVMDICIMRQHSEPLIYSYCLVINTNQQAIVGTTSWFERYCPLLRQMADTRTARYRKMGSPACVAPTV
jgi:hypothetical protein